MGDEDEILLRYHFGDLSEGELARLEHRLSAEPELRTRLASLRECLAANAAEELARPEASIGPSPPVPRELADRTAQAVLATPSDQNGSDRCVGRRRFSLAEVVTVGVAAMLLGTLILPAMQAGRETSRRLACEKGLLDISQGLFLYANDHGSRYPAIGPGENAGLFTVSLADGAYVTRPTLQQALLCPSSELATYVAQRRAAVVVPTRAELQVAPPLLADRLRRLMAGSVAYRLGHLEGDRYVTLEKRSNCRAPLLADAPQLSNCGTVVTYSHGGCGQNVLYGDGHVDFQSGCWAPGDVDHLFLNDAGEVAAGRRPHDAVLAPSGATPGVLHVVRFGR